MKYLGYFLLFNGIIALTRCDTMSKYGANAKACEEGVTFREDAGTITSPTGAGLGGKHLMCKWTIETRKDTYIYLEFQSFNIPEGSGICSYGYLEVFDGNTTHVSKMKNKKLCGKTELEDFIAKSNSIIIIFYATKLSVGQQFSLKWSAKDVTQANYLQNNQCGIGTVLPQSFLDSFTSNSIYHFEKEYLDATEGSWPWHVMITLDGIEGHQYKQICQGTIISQSFVVTAAHCVAQFDSDDIVVYAGKQVSNVMESAEQKLFVRTVSTNPEWKSDNQQDDIGLLQLKMNIIFTPYVRPLCLLPAKVVNVDRCVVAGWTITDTYTYQSTHNLKEIEIGIMENHVCDLVVGLSSNSTQGQNVLCAERSKGSRRVTMFNEDTGGALMCRKGTTWHLIGVTSKVVAVEKNSHIVLVHSKVDLDWIKTVADVLPPKPSQLVKHATRIDPDDFGL